MNRKGKKACNGAKSFRNLYQTESDSIHTLYSQTSSSPRKRLAVSLHDHSLLFSTGSVQSFPSFQDLDRVFGVDIAGAAPDCCCRYNVPKKRCAVSFYL